MAYAKSILGPGASGLSQSSSLAAAAIEAAAFSQQVYHGTFPSIIATSFWLRTLIIDIFQTSEFEAGKIYSLFLARKSTLSVNYFDILLFEVTESFL